MLENECLSIDEFNIRTISVYFLLYSVIKILRNSITLLLSLKL